MTNSNIKELTLKDIQKVSKKLDSQKVIFVELDGKQFKVKIDEYFRKSKQASLLDDIVKFMTTIEDKGNLDLSVAYTKFLMVKHFTDLNKITSDNVAESVALLKNLIDLDLLDQIVDAMPEDEVTKMTELITNNINGLKDQYEEIAKEIENEELKELLLSETE